MAEETTQVQVEKQVTGKVGISFSQPTPMWATWVFRIVFLLTTAATIVISADPDIKDGTKVKIMVYMKAFDFFVWGIGKGLGVKKDDFTEK